MSKVFTDCINIIKMNNKKLFCKQKSHYINNAIPCINGSEVSCKYYIARKSN